MNIENEAAERAVEAIDKCVTPNGLFASGDKGGYTSVWARDSMITMLGASLYDKKFSRVFRSSIETLARHQSALGQVPNCVDIFEPKRKRQVTFATIDSTLWFLIGEYAYSKAFKDGSLLRAHSDNIEKAFLWLKNQDAGEDGMPEQQPTSDWQDCFPHEYGHVLNTQAMYYCALKLYGREILAEKIKKTINGPKGADRAMFNYGAGFYLPWMWKNHNGIKEQGTWFDSLGNLLAINFGLADRRKGLAILNYVERKKINRPYPVRCMYPALKKGDAEWQPYFTQSLSAKPWWYLNGGIWPFIGGFYVSALVAAGKFKKAEGELKLLAKANSLGINRKWEFSEWVNPITGKAQGGAYQAWSAGGYLFAYSAVKERKVPVFGTVLK